MFSDTGKKQKHVAGEQMELARLEIEIRAAHKDLFNGEMVGYALGSRITKDLVVRSLLMAVKIKQPQGGLIHHFDRGSQYCSHDYVKLLGRFNMRVSMSRKGN